MKFKKQSLERDGEVCPFCGKENISFGMFDGDSNQVWQVTHCKDCDKKFNVVYELTDIEEYD